MNAAAPVVRWLGVEVHSPASFVTNLVLAGQCLWLLRGVRRRLRHRPERAGWSLFFGGLAAATFLGSFKHGFPDLRPEVAYQIVKGGSNVSLALAVVGLQRAVLPRAAWLAPLFVAALLTTNLFSREFGYTAVVLAGGMLPVVGRSAVGVLRRRAITPLDKAWACLCLAGAVWGLRLGLSPWFDHTDVAHVVLMVGFVLFYRAALTSPHPPVGHPADAVARVTAAGGSEEPSWI